MSPIRQGLRQGRGWGSREIGRRRDSRKEGGGPFCHHYSKQSRSLPDPCLDSAGTPATLLLEVIGSPSSFPSVFWAARRQLPRHRCFQVIANTNEIELQGRRILACDKVRLGPWEGWAG
jgi:hypothetical protein